MNRYRIKKGIKGYPGKIFETTDNIEVDKLLTGTVIANRYKAYGNRVYEADELEEVK
jgi:hypothetical protein